MTTGNDREPGCAESIMHLIAVLIAIGLVLMVLATTFALELRLSRIEKMHGLPEQPKMIWTGKKYFDDKPLPPHP